MSGQRECQGCGSDEVPEGQSYCYECFHQDRHHRDVDMAQEERDEARHLTNYFMGTEEE